MLGKILLVSVAILGISLGGVTKGRHDSFRRGGYEIGKPYLMGGDVVRDRTYPYMVSVRYNDKHVCGGVILNEFWILTAAQCIENRSPSSITAVIGSNDINTGVMHTVSEVKPHELYNAANSWINDIALIRVKEPIAFTWGTLAGKLPPKGQSIKSSGYAVGWGSLLAGGDLSPDLRRLHEYLWEFQSCKSAYVDDNLHVYEDQFCAGGDSGLGTCDGDMGGPFIVNDEVVGIISWGRPCGLSDYPTVYTQVSKYIDWINGKINQV